MPWYPRTWKFVSGFEAIILIALVVFVLVMILRKKPCKCPSQAICPQQAVGSSIDPVTRNIFNGLYVNKFGEDKSLIYINDNTKQISIVDETTLKPISTVDATFEYVYKTSPSTYLPWILYVIVADGQTLGSTQFIGGHKLEIYGNGHTATLAGTDATANAGFGMYKQSPRTAQYDMINQIKLA